MIETFLGLALLTLGFIAADGIAKVKKHIEQKRHKAQMDELMALPHGNLKKRQWSRDAGENIYTEAKLFADAILASAEKYLAAVKRGLPERSFDSQAEMLLFVTEQLDRKSIDEYRLDSDD